MASGKHKIHVTPYLAEAHHSLAVCHYFVQLGHQPGAQTMLSNPGLVCENNAYLSYGNKLGRKRSLKITLMCES